MKHLVFLLFPAMLEVTTTTAQTTTETQTVVTYIPPSGWTATSSSQPGPEDEGSGGGLVEHGIDNDVSTYWSSAWGPTEDSLYYAVDMQSLKSINGIYLMQRNAGWQQISRLRLYTSPDGTNWSYQGIYHPAAGTDRQLLPISGSAINAQYYTIVVDSVYGDSEGGDHTTCIAETGAYTSVDVTYIYTTVDRTGWIGTASSDPYTNHGEDGRPDKALDGDNTTYWSSDWGQLGTPPVWYQIDMLSAQTIGGVYLTTRSNNGYSTPSNVTISTSTNGTDWIVQGTYAPDAAQAVATPGNTVFHYNFTTPVSARFYKITVNSTNYSGSNTACIAETGAYTYTEETLPVRLSRAFSAKVVGAKVNLSWATASEQNSAYFDVLKSTDGKSFTKIGRVAAAGTSAIVKDYGLTDENPAIGINYYELKQVDLNGASEIFPIISVKYAGKTASIAVWPVPASSTLNVTLPLPASQTFVVQLFDLNGKAVAQKNISAGTISFQVDVSALPVGIYILQYGSESIKIVKK